MRYDPSLHALRVVDAFLGEQPLPVSPEHTCPYLPDRRARTQGFAIDELDPEIYVALMNRGFRRSGRLVYRPACSGCRACIPIRVVVDQFRPSRSQRRTMRRNADVNVQVGPPTLTDEKYRLFAAYLAHQHDGTMSSSLTSMRDFLYESPVDSLEFVYRVGGEIVGLSIADCAEDSLSSVYAVFKPQHARRSIGIYSAMWEIDYCRRYDKAHYYLGYYVAGSKTMAYKAAFQPAEILDGSQARTGPVRWMPLLQDQP